MFKSCLENLCVRTETMNTEVINEFIFSIRCINCSTLKSLQIQHRLGRFPMLDYFETAQDQ